MLSLVRDQRVISACSVRAQRTVLVPLLHAGQGQGGVRVSGRAGDGTRDVPASTTSPCLRTTTCVAFLTHSGGSAAWCTVYAAYMLYVACMLHVVACCTYVACCMLHAARCMSLCALRCWRARESPSLRCRTPRPRPRAHEPRARRIGLTPHQRHWRADALDG